MKESSKVDSNKEKVENFIPKNINLEEITKNEINPLYDNNITNELNVDKNENNIKENISIENIEEKSITQPKVNEKIEIERNNDNNNVYRNIFGFKIV